VVMLGRKKLLLLCSTICHELVQHPLLTAVQLAPLYSKFFLCNFIGSQCCTIDILLLMGNSLVRGGVVICSLFSSRLHNHKLTIFA
jgi:hypothetical protein